MTDKITLVNEKGPTSINIEVEITGTGDLLFSGCDIGSAPSEIFGDSDYEYWLTIDASQKDLVLLALIEKLYAGNTSVISAFKDYLESKGIPCKFTTY